MAVKNEQDQGTVDKPESASIKGAKSAEDLNLASGRQVLTSEPKKSADKTSYPGGDADPEDPPVRTTRPDVPVVNALATGAGQHVPPDPDDYTPEGRPRDLPGSDE
jgi:hypothetical protein